MRTYVLALSRYPIAINMLIYTVISFLQIRKIGNYRENDLADRILIALLFLNQALAFGTIFVSTGEIRIILFWLFQAAVFGAAILMYRTIYPNCNRILYTHVIMMLSVGLIIITRLSFDKAVKQFVIASIGIIVTLAVPAFMKKFRYARNLVYLYAVTGIAALSAVFVIGRAVNGSNLSFTIAGVTLQPSEFVKILYVLFLASAYYYAADFHQILIAGFIAMIHVGILILSKDLGSGLIYYVVFLFMTLLASGKYRYLVAGTGLGAAGALICYRLFSHVRVRVTAWLDPWSVIDGMGYQITQSLFAISGGGLFGAGLTRGTPNDIPYVESDFIYAAVCEELGLIFGMCLLALCLIIFLNILWIALNFADRFYRLMTFGFAVTYIFQSFLTIGGEVRFIPLTGVTLPLVSYGGSSVLSTIIMFSMIEAIFIMQQDRLAKYERRYEAEQRQRARYHADYGQRAERYREVPMRLPSIPENERKPKITRSTEKDRLPLHRYGQETDTHLRQEDVTPGRTIGVRDAVRQDDGFLDDGMTEDLSEVDLREYSVVGQDDRTRPSESGSAAGRGRLDN